MLKKHIVNFLSSTLIYENNQFPQIITLITIVIIGIIIIFFMHPAGLSGNSSGNGFNASFGSGGNNDDKKILLLAIVATGILALTFFSGLYLGYETRAQIIIPIYNQEQQQHNYLLFMEKHGHLIKSLQEILLQLDLPTYRNDEEKLRNIIKIYNELLFERNTAISNLVYQYAGTTYQQYCESVNSNGSFINSYSFKDRNDFEITVNNIIKSRKFNIDMPLISRY